MSGVPLYSVNNYCLPTCAQGLREAKVLHIRARSRASHSPGGIYTRCGSSSFQLLDYSWNIRPFLCMHFIFWSFPILPLEICTGLSWVVFKYFSLGRYARTLSCFHYIIQNRKLCVVTFFPTWFMFLFLNQTYQGIIHIQ